MIIARPAPAPRALAAALVAALAAIASTALAAAPPSPTTADRCIAEGGLPAAALAPPLLLGGEDFRVQPCARLVGGMAQFVIEAQGEGSDAVEPRSITVESLDLLERRVAEMEAVRRLRAMGAAGTAGRASASSLRQTGATLAGVVTRPVESVVGLPAGALRVFGRRAEHFGERAAAAGDRALDAFAHGDPRLDVVLRPRAATPLPPEPEPWWHRGGDLASSLGKRWLGYTTARRELGEALGIDPYTANPWLDAETDRLAWSTLVGRRSAGFGLGQVGGSAARVLGGSHRIHRMVWEQSPEDVADWNAGRLAPLACSPAVRGAFLGNARYSPTLQTQAVDALLALVPQRGCDTFLGLAAGVEREAEARFVVDALHLLVAARPRFPSRFEALGEALVLRDAEDRLLLALPVDHLQWTPESAAFFAAAHAADARDRRLLLGREASPEARAALLAAGWVIEEQALGPAREAQARPTPVDPAF
ncbi:MAG TPA: hypothetical protein DCM32_07755 [Xanthomonadaceae bacterium]|jgi:hypothetical protein|nr:hypothetical protein [Xanthomonadaceae bacterium]